MWNKRRKPTKGAFINRLAYAYFCWGPLIDVVEMIIPLKE